MGFTLFLESNSQNIHEQNLFTLSGAERESVRNRHASIEAGQGIDPQTFSNSRDLLVDWLSSPRILAGLHKKRMENVGSRITTSFMLDRKQ
jgi:hypothetical protein